MQHGQRPSIPQGSQCRDDLLLQLVPAVFQADDEGLESLLPAHPAQDSERGPLHRIGDHRIPHELDERLHPLGADGQEGALQIFEQMFVRLVVEPHQRLHRALLPEPFEQPDGAPHRLRAVVFQQGDDLLCRKPLLCSFHGLRVGVSEQVLCGADESGEKDGIPFLQETQHEIHTPDVADLPQTVHRVEQDDGLLPHIDPQHRLQGLFPADLAQAFQGRVAQPGGFLQAVDQVGHGRPGPQHPQPFGGSGRHIVVGVEQGADERFLRLRRLETLQDVHGELAHVPVAIVHQRRQLRKDLPADLAQDLHRQIAQPGILRAQQRNDLLSRLTAADEDQGAGGGAHHLGTGVPEQLLEQGQGCRIRVPPQGQGRRLASAGIRRGDLRSDFRRDSQTTAPFS